MRYGDEAAVNEVAVACSAGEARLRWRSRWLSAAAALVLVALFLVAGMPATEAQQNRQGQQEEATPSEVVEFERPAVVGERFALNALVFDFFDGYGILTFRFEGDGAPWLAWGWQPGHSHASHVAAGVPGPEDIGVSSVTVVATNEEGVSARATFDLEVVVRPVLAVEPVIAGESWSIALQDLLDDGHDGQVKAVSWPGWPSPVSYDRVRNVFRGDRSVFHPEVLVPEYHQQPFCLAAPDGDGCFVRYDFKVSLVTGAHLPWGGEGRGLGGTYAFHLDVRQDREATPLEVRLDQLGEFIPGIGRRIAVVRQEPFNLKVSDDVLVDGHARWGGQLTYSASGLPDWLELRRVRRSLEWGGGAGQEDLFEARRGTGREKFAPIDEWYLSGTPGADTPWEVPVTLSVTDGRGASASAELSIKVSSPPRLVTLIPDVSFEDEVAGLAYRLDLRNHFRDPDMVNGYVGKRASWLSGRVEGGDLLVYDIEVTAYGEGDASTSSLGWDTPGTGMSLSRDGVLTFGALPDSNFGGAWGDVRHVLRLEVTATATDQAGLQAQATFTLDYSRVDRRPEAHPGFHNSVIKFVEPGDTLRVDASRAFHDLVGYDDDGRRVYGALRYSASGLPPWLRLDEGTGIIEGVVGAASVGDAWRVVVTATDSAGQSAGDFFIVQMEEPLRDGYRKQPRMKAMVGEAFGHELRWSQYGRNGCPFGAYGPVDPATVEYRFSAPAPWLTAAGFQLSGTPGAGDVTEVPILVYMSAEAPGSCDPRKTFQLREYFELDVTGANRPPEQVSRLPDAVAVVDGYFLYAIPESAFKDPDGDPLRFHLLKGPAWLERTSPGTPHVYGQPDRRHVTSSPETVTLAVQDGYGGRIEATFQVSVTSRPRSVTQSLAVTGGGEFHFDMRDIAVLKQADPLCYMATMRQVDSGSLAAWVVPQDSVMLQGSCSLVDAETPYLDQANILHVPMIRYQEDDGLHCYEASWRYDGEDDEVLRFNLDAAAERACGK